MKSIIDAPDSGWFVPEIREAYEYICGEGMVWDDIWHDDDTDNDRLAIGNVYRVGEGQRQLDKQKATIKYLRKIAELRNGEKVDWGNSKQKKYFAKYNHANHKVEIIGYYTLQSKDTDWHSLSEKAAKEALSILSEEEIDLIFNS